MRARSAFFINFLLAGILAQDAARAEVMSPMPAQEWASWTERFRTRTDSLEACDPTHGAKGPPPVALRMQNYSCAEVFASTPPKSLPDYIYPDEWQDPKKLTHYWPVCSLTMSSYMRARDSDTITGSLQDAVDYSKKNDACAPKPQSIGLGGGDAGGTEDRYSKSYVAPSAAKAKLPPPMSGDEKTNWENYIRITQAAVADQCCASGDSECVEDMNHVRLVWCDPPADPNAPNECLRGAGFHMKEEERDGIIKWATAQKGNPPAVVSGEVIFSPYAKVMSQKRVSIAHEFAHACSLIQRQLLAKRHEASYEDAVLAIMDKNRHCAIDPTREQLYRKLFANAGWESASSDCFLETARATGKGNGFDSDCENACPGQMLEEGFAQAQGLKLQPNQRWIPNVLPGGCADSRDSRHISGAQIIRCMAKTPSFQDRIKAVTGCRP
jgi:hypothetical protein